MKNPFCYCPRLSHAALACLFLLFCLGLSGCEKKQAVETPAEQPTHDASGYLIQPAEDFLVRGESPGWKNLFIQIEVDGNEARPFILEIADSSLPHDCWTPAPAPKKDKEFVSHDILPTPEDSSDRPLGSVALNTDEITMLTNAIQKYYEWSETAAKENLNVEEKQMLNLTNQHFTITFSRTIESSNAVIKFYVPDLLLSHGSLPLPPFSITLDKLGVNRLLSVITNLPSRRDKFIAFNYEQEKIVRQRSEAQQNDKVLADQLLH